MGEVVKLPFLFVFLGLVLLLRIWRPPQVKDKPAAVTAPPACVLLHS